MASLIPGYEYDIFISYRQKDNKYDGWVTEFVDNLERELDSMFKEEISVYFDINPSDYLLENYDVDASLKDKLKCLVFIPVISRTYCDPKAFAWKYEFIAFYEQASGDNFGMKVKLPNSNTASRVLPVRIHDLDGADVTLFESTIGGVLRPIDFIYKETGVNRQLRAKDDDIINSPGHVLYRDQINKVALAIREIIQGMRSLESGDGDVAKEKEIKTIEEKDNQGEVPAEQAVRKRDRSIDKTQPVGADPVKKGMPVRKFLTGRFLVLLLILLFIITGAILLLNYRSKVIWAKDEGLKEIERLYEGEKYVEAFNLAKKAEKYISKDTVLQELLTGVSTSVTILTDPSGADIYWKEYADTSGNWIYLGQTPIDSLQVPVLTFYRLRIDMAGYEPVFGATWTEMDTLARKLLKTGEIPEGMVYVDGYWDEDREEYAWDENLGFFLDKYEVTNRQYKEFVDHGGYRIQDYWKDELIKEGNKVSWEVAMADFVDKTGRPGPSNWEAGDYPDGQEDYPVSGISWYEATAYAEFAGKELPTGDHWDSGVGYQFVPGWGTLGSQIIPLSNFAGNGPIPAGQKPGISFYGAYDMAGNVREWCWNESPVGRIISGAGYESPTYLFLQWDQLPPFDRSPLNGFRCAIYIDRGKIPKTAFRFIDLGLKNDRDCASETPVPESTYQIYKNQFLYDRKDLNAVVEMKDESADDWILEKVTFDAAYENQRMIAYLFLPKNSSPPYQTLIFFPGSYALRTKNDFLPQAMENVKAYLDYVLKSGRAALYPIYIGTYERNDGETYTLNSHKYTEMLVKRIKDFSRTIDYLESRNDIDTGKLGYYGHSWGGRLGAIVPAVEDRLSLNILVAAGFPKTKPYPEADEINYVSRVKIPTLILNGRYDAIFPLEKNVMPFFNLLGTPEDDKRLYLIDAGHNFYKRDRINEILNWCDRYFGPPNYVQKNEQKK